MSWKLGARIFSISGVYKFAFIFFIIYLIPCLLAGKLNLNDTRNLFLLFISIIFWETQFVQNLPYYHSDEKTPLIPHTCCYLDTTRCPPGDYQVTTRWLLGPDTPCQCLPWLSCWCLLGSDCDGVWRIIVAVSWCPSPATDSDSGVHNVHTEHSVHSVHLDIFRNQPKNTSRLVLRHQHGFLPCPHKSEACLVYPSKEIPILWSSAWHMFLNKFICLFLNIIIFTFYMLSYIFHILSSIAFPS